MKPTFYVGSLPFLSVPDAIQFVKDRSAHLPFLPQLPELNPQEDMIGQVLRGFELGFWDEKASVALEAFQNVFSESPRFKIQIAGPYTVSRALCLSQEEVWTQWKNLVLGVSQQLRQGNFQGEMWLQIDEPFWSKDQSPQSEYFENLKTLQEGMTKTVWGLHSCATLRPALHTSGIQFFQFLSFDCERTPVSNEELALWQAWLGERPKRVLAWGGTQTIPPNSPQIWASATCGLAGASKE